MRLGMKGAAFEPRVQAFAHDPLHIFLGDLQVSQQALLKGAALRGLLAQLSDPFQGQRHMSLENLFNPTLANRIQQTRFLCGVLQPKALAYNANEVLDVPVLADGHARVQKLRQGFLRPPSTPARLVLKPPPWNREARANPAQFK
jgi:hypothetical protein